MENDEIFQETTKINDKSTRAIQIQTQVKSYDASAGKFLNTGTSPKIDNRKEKRKIRSKNPSLKILTNEALVNKFVYKAENGEPHSTSGKVNLLVPAKEG